MSPDFSKLIAQNIQKAEKPFAMKSAQFLTLS
jgi:hypothetical protein